jgi:hypothetical protein
MLPQTLAHHQLRFNLPGSRVRDGHTGSHHLAQGLLQVLEELLKGEGYEGREGQKYVS